MEKCHYKGNVSPDLQNCNKLQRFYRYPLPTPHLNMIRQKLVSPIVFKGFCSGLHAHAHKDAHMNVSITQSSA